MCTGIWKGLFNWTDTADQGWLLPVANETEAFFNMLFDYGIATATPDGPISDPWPNAWLPPAVKAGWKGINVAAYETDFFHNLEVGTPEYRQVYGAGFKLVEGIHKSAKQRNMTVQLCAGIFMGVASRLLSYVLVDDKLYRQRPRLPQRLGAGHCYTSSRFHRLRLGHRVTY